MTITAARSIEETPTGENGYHHVTVTPVGEFIGARIGGVRVDGNVGPEAIQEIRRALLRHKVIFFSDQDHLDDLSHYEFASLLGQPTAPHPTVRGRGDAVLPIDSTHGKANSWHTDVSFVDRVPAMSLLRPVTLPTYGGSTVWANTVHAYDRLHPALRSLVDDLWAVHSNVYDYVSEHDEGRIGGIDVEERAYRAEFESQVFQTEHPVVRVHPETEEHALLLGHFVQHFVGLTSQDSTELFALLQRHVTRLENTARWDWSPGDLAVWDNRATQHYGVADYGDQQRLLHRITLSGDVPVSVDGVTSTARSGDASAYSDVA